MVLVYYMRYIGYDYIIWGISVWLYYMIIYGISVLYKVYGISVLYKVYGISVLYWYR